MHEPRSRFHDPGMSQLGFGLPFALALQRLHLIRAGQRAALDFEMATSLEGTDHAAIARGFGCRGETVERVEDFAPALRRALDASEPTVIDCRTRFVAHPCMPAFGSMNRFRFEEPTGRPRSAG